MPGSLVKRLCWLVASTTVRALHHLLDPADGQHRNNEEDGDAAYAALQNEWRDRPTLATVSRLCRAI